MKAIPIIDGKKICSSCKIVKPISEFYKDTNMVAGYKSMCKSCYYTITSSWRKSHKEVIYAADKKRRINNPEKTKIEDRKKNLKRNFNITSEDYNNLLEKQNNKCAICESEYSGRKDYSNFCVDHDHITNRIRGLLCGPCNMLLGNANDSLEILKSAIGYLLKDRGMNV
jgi:hypothetical protein